MPIRLPVKRPAQPILLTLIFGTSLSILAALAVARWEQASYRLQFQRQTDSLTTALQRSINRYTELLLALGDFYRVSEETVTRDGFNRFVARSLATYPAIQALEWAPVVRGSDRLQFEATQQLQGFPQFQITERNAQGSLVPAPLRSEYVPVTYLQPWLGNEPALGYNLTSDPTRRRALTIARDTGHMSASGRIHLVQENKNQFGFLVFLPLYGSLDETGTGTATSATFTTPMTSVTGYLLGVFRVSDVAEESLKTLIYDIDVALRDDTAPAAEQFLGRYDAATQRVTTEIAALPDATPLLCPNAAACTQRLSVSGRQWAVTFAPAAGYPRLTLWSTFSTLVIGLLLTAIVARYLAQTQAELARTRELSDLKIRLFSMASHELRTPLSTILLSAQTLEAIALSPTQQPDPRPRIYGRIRAAAKRMNQLLNDLLTLSRAESGKLDFEPEILDLRQYCQQLIEEVRFSFEAPPPIDFVVRGNHRRAYLDPQLIRAILTNLLSNAVKYSGSGPQVVLTLIDQPHQIILEVKDQGIGISSADQAHLHEAFYRGENVGHVVGTGLGLSVVNACVQLHGGSLLCNSQLGQGTVFQVKLPRIE